MSAIALSHQGFQRVARAVTSPRWQHLRYALIVFLVSRAALFAVTFVGHFLIPREAPLPGAPQPFGPASYFSAWCRDGVDANAFPLFPSAVRVFATVSGDHWTAAFLVANLACLLCLWGIIRLFCEQSAEKPVAFRREQNGEPDGHGGRTPPLTREPLGDDFAHRAAVIAAVFPTSFFLSAPVPDSTVFALFLWTSAAFAWRRPVATAVLGFALAFSHIYGVLLFPSLIVATVVRDGRDPRRWGRDALALLAMPLGLVAAHLAGARIDVGRLVGVPWAEFLAAVGAIDWTFAKRGPIAISALLNIGAIALLSAATLSCARRRAWADFTFALVFLMAALATPRIDLALRITAIVGPAIFFLARITERPVVDRFVLSASSLLLGLLATRFVNGIP